MTVFKRLIFFEQTYNQRPSGEGVREQTQLTPYRKSWREELKGKHSYSLSRRKCGLLKQAGEWQLGFLAPAYTSADCRGKNADMLLIQHRKEWHAKVRVNA